MDQIEISQNTREITTPNNLKKGRIIATIYKQKKPNVLTNNNQQDTRDPFYWETNGEISPSF